MGCAKVGCELGKVQGGEDGYDDIVVSKVQVEGLVHWEGIGAVVQCGVSSRRFFRSVQCRVGQSSQQLLNVSDTLAPSIWARKSVVSCELKGY